MQKCISLCNAVTCFVGAMQCARLCRHGHGHRGAVHPARLADIVVAALATGAPQTPIAYHGMRVKESDAMHTSRGNPQRRKVLPLQSTGNTAAVQASKAASPWPELTEGGTSGTHRSSIPPPLWGSAPVDARETDAALLPCCRFPHPAHLRAQCCGSQIFLQNRMDIICEVTTARW